MFLKSILFCFCLFYLGSNSAKVEDDQIIEIPRKLFEELMNKRNELIRLSNRTGQINPTNITNNATNNVAVNSTKRDRDPIFKMQKNFKNLMRKVKQWRNEVKEDAGNWKNKVVEKANYEENAKSLKVYVEGFKTHGKQLINVTSRGVREIFRISRKLFAALFKINETP